MKKQAEIIKQPDGTHTFEGYNAAQWDELSKWSCDPAEYDMADELKRLDEEETERRTNEGRT